MIGQGITDFFLALHNENREVSERFVESFRGRANLTLIHHNNPRYMQAAVTNVILSMARSEGFDVFLPFDADEFFVPREPNHNLREVISDWVSSGNGEQMIVPMVNYLAPSDVEDFRASTLARMPYRVELNPDVDRLLVSSRLRQHFKSIVRISGVRFAHLIWIVAGSHSALRGATNTPSYSPGVDATPPIFVCHIPWRSRASTLEPPLLGRALGTAAPLGDHTSDSDDYEVLQSTWDEYSLTPQMLDGANLKNDVFCLVEDDTCQRILRGIVAAEFDPDDEYCVSTLGDSPVELEFTSRVLADDMMFESAVAAMAGQVQYAADLRANGASRRAIRENTRRKRELIRQLRQQRKVIRDLRNEISLLQSQVRPPSMARRAVNRGRRLISKAISRLRTKRLDD